MFDVLFVLKEPGLFSRENIVLMGIAIFWMIISSIQDFKRREVENWWNYSLIVIALVFRVFVSVSTWDYRYFVWGLVGLVGGFIIANAFYYSRLFAGGDAKLLMALGTILPFSFSWNVNLVILLFYILCLLFAGAIYGVVYSLFIIFFNYSKFKKEFFKVFRKFRKIVYIADIVIIFIILFFIFMKFNLGVYLGLILLVSVYMFVYAKAIEGSCMEKFVEVSKLTIGDWTKNNIKAGKKTIKPNWEGLSEDEVIMIKKYCHGKVLVKEGIPFVPVFLIAFVLLLLAFKFF
jgi:Flp pilus assembly protein protease CpaA